MNALPHLSPDESRVLDEILAGLSARAQFPVSLEWLFQRWSDFVIQLENGYRDSIYEYTNDLSTRDLIQDVWVELPESVRQKLVQILEPLDARYKKATREAEHPLSSTLTEKSRYWWFRIPKKAGKEFENDFRSEGILE